jgi:hypothetical protein
MATTITSPADIVNVALAKIGYKLRINNLYEGSLAAQKTLDIYGQTRDQVLRLGEWPFAQRDLRGTLIKSAPPGGYFGGNVWDNLLHPPLPWLFEYVYPSDCIKVRAVKPADVLLPNFSPQYHMFTVANDANQRVILSNVAQAVVTYTGQITNPTDMPPDFVEALSAALARRLAPSISTIDAVKLEAQEEQLQTVVSQKEQM